MASPTDGGRSGGEKKKTNRGREKKGIALRTASSPKGPVCRLCLGLWLIVEYSQDSSGDSENTISLLHRPLPFLILILIGLSVHPLFIYLSLLLFISLSPFLSPSLSLPLSHSFAFLSPRHTSLPLSSPTAPSLARSHCLHKQQSVLVCVCTGEPIHSAAVPRSTGEPEVLHVSQSDHAPVHLRLFLWSARLLPETEEEEK
ncbi:uncharacterized protein LOC121577676 [Coregonus clupeaformis]|uniref:uncharacterized protein LOC121577676 n=1 Tax=Coregonus clupeaformis TaxID=59861 RepID=UPI001BE07F75|nr:uncharacterized protein LOC121577676 [Coregonus clupeaformis]